MVLHLNTEELEELFESSDEAVVCDFWAPWCGPCRMLAPVFEKVAAKYEGKAKFVKIDVDENEDLAHELGIYSIPAIFVFKKGEVVNSAVGYMNEAKLSAFVEANL